MNRSNTLQDAAAAVSAEERFAHRVRLVLDRSAAGLPANTLERLALARKTALRAQPAAASRRVAVPELATASGDSSRFGFARTGLVVSAILLVGVCLAGLYQVEQDHRIQDLADVDSGVLNDDLPISAYADHGFNAYLKQNP